MMTGLLERYAAVVGEDVIQQLLQLARPLRGKRVVNVNSTRVGGGVAEILAKLVPLTRELELDARWEVITGAEEFFICTKAIHNALQGQRATIPETLWKAWLDTNAACAEQLGDNLNDADFVFIHDPQPAPLIRHRRSKAGKWIWRCHIDASHPERRVWMRLHELVADYDASVFSLPSFAKRLPHPQYIVPPSIDPLSEKNVALDAAEIEGVRRQFGLDAGRPLALQVSRFDRFKDPVGVIQAVRIAKRFVPDLQLVLVGGTATDDPEGDAVHREVLAAAGDTPDVHVIVLPPDAHRTINGLQRAADIVLQKSTKEGFGLTVTEALWKGKPVIGGDTGGIRLQVIDYQTGFLVNTPEGAALRIRYLLSDPERMARMGRIGHEFVRQNFLLTRQLREYLTMLVALQQGAKDRVALV
jgi:trehalose synthase